MTAHPKLDPKTGEMLFFGYMATGMFSRDVSYQTVDPGGRLTRSERFEAPFASMMHDFIATAEHVVFPVFPVTASIERAMAGGPPLAWNPDLGTHLAGEPVFVPRSADAPEGDGYLLSVVHRGRENRSDLVFLDANNVAVGPVACAELPHRVPYGFHGNWRPND